MATEVGVFFSAQTGDVMMERSYAAKMLVKHRLTYEQLPLVQRATDRGSVFAGKKANHLEFVLLDGEREGGDYKLALKTAGGGQEVWSSRCIGRTRSTTGPWRATSACCGSSGDGGM